MMVAGDELFKRKIPETIEELKRNLLYSGSYAAANWFDEVSRKYRVRSIAYPHQLGESRREIKIPEEVVVDMFRAVPLRNGEKIYQNKEISLTIINVHDLYTLQKTIFQRRVEYFKEFLHTLPEKPTLLISGEKAAIYMPPIVELYEDDKPVIIDGVHRSYAKGIVNGHFGVVLISVTSYRYLPAKLQGKLLDMPLHKGWTIPSTVAKFENLRKDLFRMYNYFGFGKGGKKNGRYV